MKKFLLASTISMISVMAFAEPVRVQQIPANQAYTNEHPTVPAVYQKQTVVRYNTPTCRNCQTTTTVNRVVSADQTVVAATPSSTGACNRGCSTCGQAVAPAYAPAPAPVYYTAPKQQKSCVYNNHKYPIGNPMFVLSEGQFSSDTVGGYLVQPKKITLIGWNPTTHENDYRVRGRFDQFQVAEQLMYGLTDWLALKLQGGYWTSKAKKSTYRLAGQTGDPPRLSSYDGTVGLQAHALDLCNLDVIVGVDATWGKTRYKKDHCDLSETYKLVTPYAIVGGQVTPYVTPYLQAGYTFAVDTKKDVADDAYQLQPGFYIQPSKYWALHPYINKVEHAKPEWHLALDFYPYQNLVVGVEGSAISWAHDPADLYGISGRIKMTF